MKEQAKDMTDINNLLQLDDFRGKPAAKTGGPKGPDEYLRKMKPGTWFFVQNNTGQMPSWMLRKLQHAGVNGKAVLLYDDSNGKVDMFFVDPDTWCRDWKLFDVMSVP